MTHEEFEASLKQINAATHYDSLWQRFTSSLQTAGADLVAYHHIAPHHSPDSGLIDILTHGYPRAWEQYCRDQSLCAHNPLFNAAYLRADMIKWSEIFNQPHLDAKQAEVISAMQEWLKGDGYMIPVFGPSGRNGVLSVGNLASIQDWPSEQIHTIKYLCTEFHLTYTRFKLSELPSNFTLDNKEHEILIQLVTGIGPQSVAENLNLTREVVEATLDRLMLTMGVSDLASLMIRAKSLGLFTSA